MSRTTHTVFYYVECNRHHPAASNHLSHKYEINLGRLANQTENPIDQYSDKKPPFWTQSLSMCLDFHALGFNTEYFASLYNIKPKQNISAIKQMFNLEHNQENSSNLKQPTADEPSNQNITLLKPQEHPEFLLSKKSSPNSRKMIEQWTQEQQDALYQSYYKHGPKWVLISKIINKSDTAVKNRFFGRIRKLGRKLSHIGKKLLKPKNPICQKMIFRVIEAPNLIAQPFEGYQKLKQSVTQSLIGFAKLEDIQIQESKHLIEQIHKFNTLSRSYNLKGLYKKQVSEGIQKDCKNQWQQLLTSSNLLHIQQNGKHLMLMDNEQIEEMFNARQYSMIGMERIKDSFWAP